MNNKVSLDHSCAVLPATPTHTIMQKTSFLCLLLLAFTSSWFLPRWTFLKELRDDIAFAKALNAPAPQPQNDTLWPTRHLVDTLNADTSLAFTSIFSDTLHHALNMHEILSASGHVRSAAYSEFIIPEIVRYLIRNSGYGHYRPNGKIRSFIDAIDDSKWKSDINILAKNVIDSTRLFPVQCWHSTRGVFDWWPTSFSALRDLHQLYSLSQNATDSDSRFRIARDFRRTQAQIETLSALTIDDSRACYRPFLEYLEERVLPTSRDVVSKGHRVLAELDYVIHNLEYDIAALPWFPRYLNHLTQVPHALQESVQALSDIRPALQGFLRDIETVHGNLELMARYSDWMLSREQPYVPASLSNPPDLTRFMSLIEDMEERFLRLDEKTSQNSRIFIMAPRSGPRKPPSIPPPTVLWDLVTLGLWCP